MNGSRFADCNLEEFIHTFGIATHLQTTILGTSLPCNISRPQAFAKTRSLKNPN